MRLHRITCNGLQQWYASGSLASKAKTELVSNGKKRNEVERDEVEVPTRKTELLAWLNKNCGKVLD